MKLRELHRSDLIVRIAWLYYTFGFTQEEISKQLNLSRPMVQRMLAQATSEGIVKIRLDHQLVEYLELEKRLMERFGLRFCRICPAPVDDSDQVLPGLSVLGASVMEEFLRSPEPITVALGTGRTIKSCVQHMGSMECGHHKVVSLVGNLKQDGSASPFDSVMSLADKIGAERYFLPAPVVASSMEELETLRQQSIYRNVIRISEQADVSFISMAGLSLQSPLYVDGFISEAEMRQALELGAAGELLGHIYDESGQLLDLDFNLRSAGVLLQRPLQRIVIGISGGSAKHHVIHCAIRGGWINGLVTDEHTARYLLEHQTSAWHPEG